MSSETRRIAEQLPLYLSGRLGSSDALAVEAALALHPALRAELHEMAAIREAYGVLEHSIPPLSPDVFEKLPARIAARPGRSPEVTGSLCRIRMSLQALFHARRVAWALVSVMSLVIVVLLTAPMRETRFGTLTSSESIKRKGVTVNVVFKEGASEREIRLLLTELGGNIISGPSPAGLYTIRVTQGDTAAVLTKIRSQRIVTFAERVY